MMSRSEATGFVLVLVAALSWSTAGLFTRVVTTDVPTTLLWRSVFGGLAMVIFYYAISNNKSRSDLFRFTVGEFVIATVSAIAMACFISAFFFTSIANVSFVYGAVPLVTMLFAWVVLREVPAQIGFFASVVSAFGIIILVWGGQNFTDFVGLGLAFMMTVFMAGTTVLAKYYPTANASKCAYLSAFLAAALVAPFSTGFDVSSYDMAWLALYGVVNVGLGFGIYLVGVSRVSALAAALVGLTEIPLAPVWAYILFGETIDLKTALGGLMILFAAVIYITRVARPAPVPSE